MKSVSLPPFRRPATEAIVAEPWYLAKVSGPVELPENLKEWDYNDVIRVSRTCSIDVRRIRHDCDLGAGTTLFLAVVYSSSGIRDRICAFRQLLSDSSGQVSIDVSIPGEGLAGQLEIFTQLIVGEVGSTAGALAPSISGSILWQQTSELDLEGVGSRFPVHERDFASDPELPEHAAWHLYVDDSDPDASFTQCVCLYINSNKTRLMEAAQGLTEGTEGRAITELMNYDLARSLVQLAVNNPEWYHGISTAASDSLRATTQRLVRSLLDVTAHDQLTGLARNPSELSARIQGRLKLLNT